MPVVVGLGNELMGDDGVGLAAARRLREISGGRFEVFAAPGGGAGLQRIWRGKSRVVLLDAMSGGGPAGEIRRFDLGGEPPETVPFRSSTHALGILDAVELDRVLGQLPGEVTAFCVEGRAFTPGTGLSPDVAGALDGLIAAVLRECGA